MTPPAAPLRVVSWCGPKLGASTQEWFRRYALTSTVIYALRRLARSEREWRQFLTAFIPVSTEAIFLGSRLRPMGTPISLVIKHTLDSA
jgi:hypothetical protein